MTEVLSKKLIESIYDKYDGDMINCARSIERNVLARLKRQKPTAYLVGNMYAEDFATAKELFKETGFKVRPLFLKPFAVADSKIKLPKPKLKLVVL
jgi:hypothetical protein